MKLISLVLLSVVFLLIAACGESTTTSGEEAKASVLKLLNSKAPGEKSIVITHVSKEGVECSKYANVKGSWKQSYVSNNKTWKVIGPVIPGEMLAHGGRVEGMWIIDDQTGKVRRGPCV
jgi:hypothetical protein